MANNLKGKERRQFTRLDFVTPLAFKICKKKTITKILEGYTANISQGGILCNIAEKVSKGDILWLSFDKGTLSICADIDRQSLIYQNGVIGKVVRIESKGSKNFSVGIQFITREEKNVSNIYPKIHFMKEQVDLEREEV